MLRNSSDNHQLAQTGTKIGTAANTHCSICRGKKVEKREAINRALGKGISYRDIEAMTGVAYRTVGNHAQHLPAIYREAKEKGILSQAVDHQAEINEQFRFAKELRIAARQYLSHPETGALTLIPRSNEITVIYDDYSDLTPKGEPKRKSETLDILLERAEKGKVEAHRTIVKHIDIRSFSLDAIKTADLVLDKIGKIQGVYEKDNLQRNTATVNQTPTERAVTLFSKMIEYEMLFENGEDVTIVLGKILDVVLRRYEDADETMVTREAERIAELRFLGAENEN